MSNSNYEKLIRIEDEEIDFVSSSGDAASLLASHAYENYISKSEYRQSYLQAKSPITRIYYRFRDVYHNTPDKLKYVSLLTLTFQNAALNLTMRSARTQKDQFSASTAVIMSELLKLISCLVMIRREEGSTKKAIDALNKNIIHNVKDTLKVAVPSIVYYVQNNLIYIGSSHLDAATSQVTYQLKILTTAIFSVLMLKKRLAHFQWAALLLLFIGIAMVERDTVTAKNSAQANTSNSDKFGPEDNYNNATVKPAQNDDDTRDENPFLGFIALLAACCLSGFAGVYFEKILKSTKQVSLWIRNTQLCIVAIPFGLIQVFLYDSRHVNEKGFFYGYSFITWICILLQAQGGLLVAVVVKYANNILKGFATSLAIIISAVASIFLFGFHITLQFFFGTTLVIASVLLYSKPIRPVTLDVASRQV